MMTWNENEFVQNSDTGKKESQKQETLYFKWLKREKLLVLRFITSPVYDNSGILYSMYLTVE